MELKIAIIEGIKEIIRNTIFMAVPSCLLIILTGINTTTGAIALNYSLLLAVFLSSEIGIILTGIDRAKHIYIKLTKNTKNKSNGLIRL